ncbi:DUF7479 domain-containing protein [Salinarchaeum laminariae]|uniref:DUF7479 domain-containing protein n=1 Tax=Salinarchaeum laminariae TaxID=869888 RepID=UPI0020BF6C16|nr:hypothetical protein [Salinarchaeum laminariae]
MTTEFDLGCATCGSALTERTVAAESLGVPGEGSLPVAECPQCGDRYVPEQTLDRVGKRKRT